MRSITIPHRARRSVASVLAIAAVVLASAVCPAGVAECAPWFAAPYELFTNGSAPLSMTVGDLNHDDRPDLVVANERFNGMTVRLGLGGGAIGDPMNYTEDGWVDAVSLGDLDGDGNIDVVLACGGVTVLRGQGDGTFGSRVNYGIPGASGVALGDLNGDGHLDVVATDRGIYSTDGQGHFLGIGDSVTVLLGNGDGTLGVPHRYDTADGPCSVVIGDFNEDGRPDLAVSACTEPSNLHFKVSILPGNGDGTFVSGPELTVDGTATRLAVDDFDRDGHVDLLAGSGQGVSIFRGRGNGTFRPRLDFAIGDGMPKSLAIGDVNRDGIADLVTARHDPGVGVFLGRGDATFAPELDFPGLAGPVVIADFDQDGAVDLAVAFQAYSDISGQPCGRGGLAVLLGHGDGTFGAGLRSATGPGGGPFAMADLNRDDRLDVAIAKQDLDVVSVLLGTGDGTFGSLTDYPTGGYAGPIAIADLDRDGTLDLVVAQTGTSGAPGGAVSVLLGIADGGFGIATAFATGSGPDAIAVGDLSGDGVPDVVTADGVSKTASILIGNGDGSLGIARQYGEPIWNTPSSVAIADVNLDGHPDVIVGADGWKDPQDPWLPWDPARFGVLLGVGDGTFDVRTFSSNFVGVSSIAVADLNEDGKPDLEVMGCILPGNGDGTFGSATCPQLGTSVTSMRIADLDGDGHLDMVVGTLDSGSDCKLSDLGVSTLLGHGDGNFGPMSRFGDGGPMGGFEIGDVNEDGRPDIVVGGGSLVLLNQIADFPTPTLLALFVGDWTAAGVELRWQFGEPARIAACAVERAEHADGPWVNVAGEPRRDGERVVFLDATAVTDHTYYYRLLATLTDGSSTTFGPLAVTTGSSVSEFALGPAVPNPAAGRVRFEFAVARASRVRLSVLDVQGREVAVLSDGVQTPGRYQATWEGTTASGRAPAGLYFVRYQANGQHWTRRFVLAR